MKTVFLDTETTGLDDEAQIIEIAIVNDAGAVLFESLVKPTVPVDYEAQEIHGIGPERLATAPAWPDIAEQVRAVLEDKRVVIFNSKFDIRLLQQTATAHAAGQGVEAYDAAVKWIMKLETVCAMYRAAKVFGATNRYGTISLVDAAAAAGVDFQGRAHSAAGDAGTTALLWKALNRREKDRERGRIYRQQKKAEALLADSKPNQLNKKEREALTELKALVDRVLEGDTYGLDAAYIGQLDRMGITLKFIPAKKVNKTIRGKGAAFTNYIAQSRAYWLSGTPYRVFMPWQIKELKKS